jgi:hypothetical protein
MMRYTVAVAVATGLLTFALSAGLAWGAGQQDRDVGVSATTQPARPAETTHGGKVTVVSVSGPAEKMAAATGAWQPLQVGEELDELTIIRTGLAAKVTLRFADRAEAVIEGAAKAGVQEFRGGDTGTRGRMGLKYGAMHLSVDRSHGPVDFQVATPVAVMSVRGTSGTMGFSADMGLNLQGESGTWQVAADQGKRTVSAGEGTDGDLSTPIDLADRRRYAPLGDMSGGLSIMELLGLRTNGDGRGSMGFIPGGTGEAMGLPGPLLRPDDHQIEPYPDGEGDYPNDNPGPYYPPNGGPTTRPA